MKGNDMAASNTPAQDDAQPDPTTPTIPAALGGGPVTTADPSALANPPVDVHLPDENEPMADLHIVGRMPGDSFTTHLGPDDGVHTPVGPLPVTVGTEATSVRESWVDKIIADARAVGVNIERVVKDVAEKVEG